MFKKIKKQRQLKKQNMLDLIPIRKSAFIVREDQRIVLQIKRFPIQNMAKLFGKSEYIHISLDEKGSQLWQLFDGQNTLAQICNYLSQTKNFENEEMLEERVAAFALSLYRQNFIDFILTDKTHNQ